jgi:hypothetical protein
LFFLPQNMKTCYGVLEKLAEDWALKDSDGQGQVALPEGGKVADLVAAQILPSLFGPLALPAFNPADAEAFQVVMASARILQRLLASESGGFFAERALQELVGVHRVPSETAGEFLRFVASAPPLAQTAQAFAQLLVLPRSQT